ncbi:MAG: ADP-ribosylglycohydrolase YegU [uncultured Rubrobacteraceae bacterium]|uniref:ADP-ribosylglycohydrolase YegU n=1 Tax=uncultured Rubrobacteraceae bacterium TaxID=349277 RepID=A0A6J4QQJ1_9ACTN|nr:MAG: ADP-ribosylglycohydrolase YegU [uncultured Rubrobacteraceae bacterium]
MNHHDRRLDRACGVLYGLAAGDALGMPTQLLPRWRLAGLFPKLDGFVDGPEENVLSSGVPAGSVTDDTEQAVVLAEVLIEGRGRLDSGEFVRRFLAWAEEAEADGSEKLGPSSRRALEAVRRGVPPEEAGRRGETSGAAMRVAPVGIAAPPEPLGVLLELVEEACRPTHNTGLAISGAAAVAAAVSAGVEGAAFGEALRLARAAAREGSGRGGYAAGAEVAERISWATELVLGLDEGDAAEALYRLVGTAGWLPRKRCRRPSPSPRATRGTHGGRA